MLEYAWNTRSDQLPPQCPNDSRTSEQSIASARASVMVYDDTTKKWIPSGTTSGLSKVHIFQNQANNTFRVVARKLNDHEVVINCVILKGLKYNQATPTFHQWRDNKQVYGLNFSCREDADAFARAMTYVLDVLNSNSLPRPPPQAMTQQPQSHYQQANGQYDEDMGYSSQMIQWPNIYHQVSTGGPTRIDLSPISHSRTMTREDVANIQERRMSQQSQISNNGNACSPSGVPVPPTPPGHHRTSSAPPAPQPPPMSLAPPPPPAPPSAPPCPPMGPPPPGMPPAVVPAGAAPPPPPPPPQPNMSRSSSNDGQDSSSLAAQLQSARLRRSNKQSAENSGSSTSSSGSNYGTLGRGGSGMASMMDEMAKTLARRRAAAEKKEVEPSPQEPDYGTAERKTWGSGNKLGNGCEASPKPSRRALASSEESLPKVNGDAGLSELEAIKQDILREMRREINKMKSDIIEAIKTELNRR
ncbi:protein enabled isoform X3 [Cimex lectularius]|uniref:WH1 domain-containing protein n=1 Tax=Cimex lectularius TaxID=79782 RepID=A0A8I6SG99_CIMLE|nr:protein enabled isoform X3 [Cimex lectularius]